MSFEDILRRNPCVTSRGIDNPDRVGFKTSRALLSADAENFAVVCDWLENHTIRSPTSHNLPHEVARTTGRHVSHGVTILALKAMGIRFQTICGIGLKF